MIETPPWARRLGSYGIVSVLVTAIDYGVFLSALGQGFRPVTANMMSWAVAVVAAYLLHSLLTFSAEISLRKFSGYIAVCSATLLIGTAVLAAANLYIVPIAAKVVSTIIVFAFSFALSHSTVFRTAKL